MILVDKQIRELIEQTDCIAPFDPDLLNPASLDVLLGDEILIEDCSGWHRVSIKDSQYVLNPNEFILACTKETFCLPNNISCEFRLKSSRAREGLGHALAVWIDPGFSDSVLTLELKNYSRYRSITLFPEMKIGQLIFHSHEPCQISYQQTGRYNGDRSVQQSKG